MYTIINAWWEEFVWMDADDYEEETLLTHPYIITLAKSNTTTLWFILSMGIGLSLGLLQYFYLDLLVIILHLFPDNYNTCLSAYTLCITEEYTVDECNVLTANLGPEYTCRSLEELCPAKKA